MNCQNCCGHDDMFDEKAARKEIRRYRRSGPKKSTKILLNALADRAVEGKTLLDIGGGIGVIPAELLIKGLLKATLVEASLPFAMAARELAETIHIEDELEEHVGDFSQLHEAFAKADIVTLDKVICCYKDYESLVTLSVEKADYLYGIVIPGEEWWVKLVHRIGSFLTRLSGSKFRSYVHPIFRVEKIIFDHGFVRSKWQRQREWVIAVYEKL
jgi:hypothetical protein